MKEPKSASVVLRNCLAPVHNAHFRRHAVICLQCKSGKIEKKKYKDSYFGNRSFQWNSLFKWKFGAFNGIHNLKGSCHCKPSPSTEVCTEQSCGPSRRNTHTVIRNNRFYNLLSFFTKAPVHLFNFISLLYLQLYQLLPYHFNFRKLSSMMGDWNI